MTETMTVTTMNLIQTMSVFKNQEQTKTKTKSRCNNPFFSIYSFLVRNDHDAEKFGEPIDEWEWRFVPAKFEYLTKEQLVVRRNKLRQESKPQELVLSSDSESEEDEDEDDCF